MASYDAKEETNRTILEHGFDPLPVSDRLFVKRRHNELALPLVFAPGHPRKAIANPPLGGVFRTADKLAGGAEDPWISQNLAIEFRPDGKHMQLRRFAERNRAECHQRTMAAMQIAHAAHRVAKKTDVFARRGAALQD